MPPDVECSALIADNGCADVSVLRGDILMHQRLSRCPPSLGTLLLKHQGTGRIPSTIGDAVETGRGGDQARVCGIVTEGGLVFPAFDAVGFLGNDVLEAAGIPVSPPSMWSISKVEVTLCVYGEGWVCVVIATIEEFDLIAPGFRSVVICTSADRGYGIEPEDVGFAIVVDNFVAEDVRGCSGRSFGGQQERFTEF